MRLRPLAHGKLLSTMQRFGPHDLILPDAYGAALACGKFDGVHLGHQAVLASARKVAENSGAALAATGFEPHPRRVFKPDAAPFLLQSLAQRERALVAAGVGVLFEFTFDAEFLNLSDREFAERELKQRLNVGHVSAGANFRYGRARVGDMRTLARDGAELGFTVEALPPVLNASGDPISSSAIRAALERGDARSANAMLGRPWAIEGVVARGFARGRDFGFPTINITLGDYLAPKLGVYAVRVNLGDKKRAGVASIGVNPTVGSLPAPLLEAHLFDFVGDLYGQNVEVEIIDFLRAEERFDSIDALKAQMARDASQARALLG